MANVNLTPQAKDKRARVAILVVTLVLSVLFAVLAAVLSDGIVGRDPNYPYGPSNPSNPSKPSNVQGTLYTGSNSVYVGDSDGVYYRFTPSSSGTYRFYSSVNSSSYDPYATLYDSSMNTLVSNDDGGGNNNFSLSRYLYSGETYYLKVSLRGGYYGSFYVYVESSY